MDAEDTQIIAVQPHIDQGEDVMEEEEEGFYAALNHVGQNACLQR